jgi:hypothetical protein
LRAEPQNAYDLVQALNHRIAGQLAAGGNSSLTEQRLQQEPEDAHTRMKQIDAEQ